MLKTQKNAKRTDGIAENLGKGKTDKKTIKTYENIGHSTSPVGGGRVPHNILEPSSGQVSVTKLKPLSGKVHQEFRAKYGPKNTHEIDAAFASGNTDQLVAKYGPDIISDYEKVQQNAITFSPYTTYWKL